MKLRDYQTKVKTNALKVLRAHGLVYIAGEVRTGKTITSLHVAKDYLYSPKPYAIYEDHDGYSVLFLTKKKAIKSIKEDFKNSGLTKLLNLDVVSIDSVHKCSTAYDLIIIDEAHTIGAFPKPSNRAKQIRKKFSQLPFILLSGTPSPESYSQLYHQFWATGKGPWTKFTKFYSWARKYVEITKDYVGFLYPVNNYSQVKSEKKVLKEFNPYKVSVTQKQAGFNGKVIEKIITLPTPERLTDTIEELRKTKVSMGGFMVADTGARLLQYYHQLCSGTYIDNEGTMRIVNKFKARYIKENFSRLKIAIFYLYVAEGIMLKKMFPNWTDQPEYFNGHDKEVQFICQITSGSMGTNLSSADLIIFFNISHSATQYFQARARSQSIDGGNKKIIWLFSDTGIEKDIYDTVQTKTNYTTKHFQLWQKKIRDRWKVKSKRR